MPGRDEVASLRNCITRNVIPIRISTHANAAAQDAYANFSLVMLSLSGWRQVRELWAAIVTQVTVGETLSFNPGSCASLEPINQQVRHWRREKKETNCSV